MEIVWQGKTQRSEKNSQYKLCPNNWMTDKLCMHGEELKGLKGENLAEAREKATLEK